MLQVPIHVLMSCFHFFPVGNHDFSLWTHGQHLINDQAHSLFQLSSASSPVLRFRKGASTHEETDSGVTIPGVTNPRRGSHSVDIPSTIPEKDEEEEDEDKDVASMISSTSMLSGSMISIHSTAL